MLKRMIKNIYNTLYARLSPIPYARKIGVTVGKDCSFLGKVSYGTEPWLITIGNHVRLAGGNGVSFITHDGSNWVLKGIDAEKYKDAIGYGRITIKDNVFVGAGTTILRGVTIANNVAIGAGAMVNKDVLEENIAVADVPVQKISNNGRTCWVKRTIGDKSWDT